MPGSTPFFAVPFSVGADAVKTVLNTVVKALADRVDYMLGESGDTTITPSAASTKTTKAIAFGRAYKTPPRVVVGFGRDNTLATISAGVASIWVDDVQLDGFTLAIHSTNTGTRDVTWHAKPARTDVTP